jgi:carboxyl-terminal processing protease
MKKPLLATLAIVSASLGTALASPAEDLIKQASFYIGFYYNGPAKIPYWRDLQKSMLTDVQKACAGDTKCAYDKAVPIIKGYLTTLNDPFTRYMTGDEAAQASFLGEEGSTGAPNAPSVGMQTRALPGQGLVVVDVFVGEPAFSAELARGDLIRTINGQAATPANLLAAELANKAFSIEYTSKGTAKTAQLTPKNITDTVLPSRQIIAAGKVMVIRVPRMFSSGIGDRVHAYVRRAIQDKVQGIVLDLRDSSGGLEDEALLSASPFIKDGGFIFDYRAQNADLTFTLSNNAIAVTSEAGAKLGNIAVRSPQSYPDKLVVLTNKHTEWTPEETAYLLQKARRAQIVGEGTSGQLGVSGTFPPTELIDGNYLMVSQMRMLNLDKTPFPNVVTPDVLVPEDLASLVQGRDTQLEKALELIGAK